MAKAPRLYGASKRMKMLLKYVMLRNKNAKKIQTLSKIVFLERSRDGIVGLTEYDTLRQKQSIKFYKSILSKMPDEAVVGVIAHEFAHAWLNEKAYPSTSKRREAEANKIASRWGFRKEIRALQKYSKNLYL